MATRVVRPTTSPPYPIPEVHTIFSRTFAGVHSTAAAVRGRDIASKTFAAARTHAQVSTTAVNPSGVSPPSGNIAGWNLNYVEDFNTVSAIGSWGPTQFQVPFAYSAHFGVYDEGWMDTAGKPVNQGGEGAPSRYSPTTVLSTSNSCLNWHLYNSGSGARSAAVRVGGDQLYGRLDMMLKSDASLHGFKTAWLFWPLSDNWPTDGEVDFPEGDLDGTISGFMHRQNGANGGDQDAGSDSGLNYYGGWRRCVLEWDLNHCKMVINGVTILDVTSRVPNTQMHFVLQTESALGFQQPASGTSGDLHLDWIAYYTRA